MIKSARHDIQTDTKSNQQRNRNAPHRNAYRAQFRARVTMATRTNLPLIRMLRAFSAVTTNKQIYRERMPNYNNDVIFELKFNKLSRISRIM